ncbi:LysR family transcriptional regulator [Aquicoccus sp. SCR17]|nr:LysR family transcriptional regulator [Carideicomes alvinocaridis]
MRGAPARAPGREGFRMQVRQLRYFVAVAEHGSFSAASAALGIAQPSIGQQIRNLEDDLGTPLFHRHSRGIALTQAGVTLLDEAQDILRHLDDARRLIRDQAEAPSGLVRIGLTLSASYPLAVPLVERLGRDFPRIRLSLVEALSDDLVRDVARDRVNLALTHCGAYPDGVRGEALAEEDYHLCVAADHPLAGRGSIALAEVLEQRMCLPPETHIMRRQIGAAVLARGQVLEVAAVVESIATSIMLAESGQLATILPYSAIARRAAEGRIAAIRITDPAVSCRLSLSFTTRRHPTRAESAVRGVLRDLTAELIAQGDLRWRRPAPLSAPTP